MALKKLKFIDLFAGIGGMRIAFEDNNCECVFSSEWDKYSQQTYKDNFGIIPEGDITLISEKKIPNHNILTGGFPCQPFSSIGKREGFEHPTQGTLFFDIIRIIKEKKPEAFLLENVSGLVNHDEGKTFKTIINTLENELGYKTFSEVLDSSDYSVPQVRKRIYIVGFRYDVSQHEKFSFTWPEKHSKKLGIGEFVESHPKNYSISEHLQKSYIYKRDDGKPQVIDKSSQIQVKTLVSTYHKIQRLTGTFVKDGETGLRLLSENECKSIMGFPSDFKFPVSRTQMYRQMGNSVAVPVVREIALQMTKTLQKISIKQKKAKVIRQ